jgi:predicted alpha/beta hydrolase family esterase
MKKEVLFIQGGSAGAYNVDAKLVASLANLLGDSYTVNYPKMPQEDDPDYEVWSPSIEQELAKAGQPLVLVAHSVGAYILLKFLTEKAPLKKPIAGICLIAAPYPSADENWEFEGFNLPDDFGAKLPKDAKVFLYHSPDDQTIPFAHLALYAHKIPGAIVRTTTGGHQLDNDLSVVAEDIMKL